MKRAYLLASALSGCAWGLIALGIGHAWMSASIWGGLIASPAIGLEIGVATRPLYGLPHWARVAHMGAALYASAILFGIATGLWEIARLADRSPFEVMLQAIYGTWWGLTFTGYVVVLWPLAYANHLLLGRWLDQPPTTGLDSTPSPSISTSIESPSFK